MNRGGLDKCTLNGYTEGAMDKLVEMLDDRRKRERARPNHTQFAEDYLQVSRGYWARLRSGKASVSKDLWQRAIDEWPELGYIPVSLFLSRGVPK